MSQSTKGKVVRLAVAFGAVAGGVFGISKSMDVGMRIMVENLTSPAASNAGSAVMMAGGVGSVLLAFAADYAVCKAINYCSDRMDKKLTKQFQNVTSATSEEVTQDYASNFVLK